MHDTVVEPVLFDQAQVEPQVGGEPGRAGSDDDRVEVELDGVDEAGPQGVGGQRGPPIVTSPSACSIRCRTVGMSKVRSSRVRAVSTVGRVVEKTTLSRARQAWP